MIELYNLKLSDLLPPSISSDKEIAVMASSLDHELQAITRCINEIILLPNIDSLKEDILDSLAWQLHVDFYEPLGLSLDKKRALVKNSLKWHRYKGTKFAVEEIIRLLFFENIKLEEWFEYGGYPFHFRLILDFNIPLPINTYHELKTAIDTCKRASAHMEALVFRATLIENVMMLSVSSTQRLSIKHSVKSLTREINRVSVSLVKPIYHIYYDNTYCYDGVITWKGHIGPYFFPTRSFDRVSLSSKRKMNAGVKITGDNNNTNKLCGKIATNALLRNQNAYKTGLTVHSSVSYDGQYCYDGTAFYDGATAQYQL